MAATVSLASPPQKNKTLHVVVFDVSGSMKAPLKLRSNARDANKNSGELDHKRVQTVFDMICRLAEDGVSEAKDQEDRTKTLELLGNTESQATTEVPQQVVKLLTDNGINSAYVGNFIRTLPSDQIQQLYTVVGREPLVQLLAKNETLALLKSIPIAAPRTLRSIIHLVKRLQTMLKEDKSKDATTCGVSASLGHSQTTFINWERLLDDIEPYLYGLTPMCKALQSVKPMFHDQAYSSKVMMLISDGDATDGNPRAPARAVRDAGGTIFSCLLTDSAIEKPRRLCGPDEADSKWPSSVHAMFDMASTVSCNSRAVQALRRRGWILPHSGQCKLFIQANNPMIIDEFTTASKEMGTSFDALAEMLRQISLDDYIQKSNKDAKVTNQGPRDIRNHLLTFFGDNDNGQLVDTVLSKICPVYKLRYKEGNEISARAAIHARRLVIATFWLDGNRWNKFVTFYQVNPKGTLTAQNMNAAPGGMGGGGHAVVLVRCDEKSLTFMNSWGPGFANKGFFTVDRASTLEISGGPSMRFYDVYWTTDELSTEEVKSWKEHQKQTGEKFIGVLPKSYHDLPVKCPHCKQSAPAKNYDCAWCEATYRACNGKFQPTAKALIQCLYDSNSS